MDSDSPRSYSNKTKKSRRKSYSRSPVSSWNKKKNKHKSSSDSSTDRRYKKSKHKRHRSSSSTSPPNSDKMEEIIRRREQEQVKQLADRKRQKELLKQFETPEQKRLRRLAKKEAKERKKKEQMGWDEEYMGYTNTDNPFGDGNLLKPFVWEKKLEKEGLKNLPEEQLEKRNWAKLEENKRELEKVKRRRLERERDREARDSELAKIQREKEAAQFKEWEKQEDVFHLQQATLRSKIRIEGGRAKPIDLLARYISTEEEDFNVEMNEPYFYLDGLTISDLEALQDDITVYKQLGKGKNQDYWTDLEIIVEDELHKLRKELADHIAERRDGISPAVISDVVSIFKNKTPSHLQELYIHIESKINSNGEGIDIGYWETLLSRLKAFMARARLRERHQENLRNKLLQLKQEQGVDSGPIFPCVRNDETSPNSRISHVEDSPQPGPSSKPDDEVPISITEEQDEPIPDSQAKEEYFAGGYSPKLLDPEQFEQGIFLIDAEDDLKKLEFNRNRIIPPDKEEPILSREEKRFEKEAKKDMDGSEAVFSVEAPMDKEYLWSDKYRPRKPRYFNRVHTGFEWNKYNQTHYDLDNPPPKVVQGYKFNIFYPDLIDKSSTPQFFLEPCEDNRDFAILRFHAGPPYEDIAFKIVNREWEYSYKRGYRSQFYNNIFQLWFHFKRYRYRR